MKLIIPAALLVLLACSTGGAPTPKTGSVSLVQTTFSTGASGSGSARFYSKAPVAPGCALSTVAGCTVTECDLSKASTEPFDFGDSAGDISFSGPSLTRVLPFTDGGYGVFLTSDRMWSPGDALVATASGAAVPAFTATLIAPAEIALTAPACSAASCGTVSRTGDLTVSWTGGSDVQALLRATKAGVSSIEIVCPLAASPATISAAALAKLGSSDAGFTGSFGVSSSKTTKVVAGSYDVTMTATATGAFSAVDVSN